MIERILPRQAGNAYAGSRVALWAFALITAVTLARSIIHVFAPDGGAQSIATVPLDAFTENAAATVVHLFALWGLSQLLMGFVYVAVLMRYRNLIPLMYVLIVAEYAGRLAIAWAKPFEVAGTAPGGVANWIIVPVALAMLVLSVRKRTTSGPDPR